MSTRFKMGTVWFTGNGYKIIKITGKDGRYITFDTLYIHTGTPSEFKFDPESSYAGGLYEYEKMIALPALCSKRDVQLKMLCSKYEKLNREYTDSMLSTPTPCGDGATSDHTPDTEEEDGSCPISDYWTKQ